jgi:calcium/proton exchanger cax
MRKIGSSVATALLLCTTLVTSVCATPVLKAVTMEREDGLSYIPFPQFFGFCLLPALAELAEFTKTCSLSYRGEMDVSFEVATTTSIHMMLLVAPIFCISAWCMQVSFGLDLGDVPVLMLLLNIWIFSIITRHGSSRYLHGSQMYGL